MTSRCKGLAVVVTVFASCAPVPDEKRMETSAGEILENDSTRMCFVSNRSVLARATSSAPSGLEKLRGWISLDHFDSNDSAPARLVDSDGFALNAKWQRIGADSIVVAGFNDFVRIEMRLRHRRRNAAGTLRASSDAALERDSVGALHEFRRNLNVRLKETSCDSVPLAVNRAAIDMLPHDTPRPRLRRPR